MNSNFAALHYKKTEKMNSELLNDTNSMVLKCYEELCNSIKIFQKNIKPTPENLKRKSSSFARALTIIYTLQSSMDFEKDLNVAKNLFQIYEYTRLALIKEFKACRTEKSTIALAALIEIRDTWKKIG